jgi:hypothetical protein
MMSSRAGSDGSPDEKRTASARIAGASVTEQMVYDYLVDHVENEADILDQYREMAAADSSPALRYLGGLIAADERRHHEVFRDLAASLRHIAELQPGEPPIPTLAGLEADHERVQALTERFLAVEHEDEEMLRVLRRKLGDVKDTTLWTLLVDLMQRDTQKHIRILEFVQEHVGGRAGRRSRGHPEPAPQDT